MRSAWVLPALLSVSASGFAQSLWDDAPDERARAEGSFSPYGAPRKEPYKRYDHLTVLIRERTRASVSAGLRVDRRSRLDTTVPNWAELDAPDGAGLPRLRPKSPGLSWNLDGRFREDDNGGTNREGILEDTMQVIVLDVKENGDLVIEGLKEREINGEKESVRVSGIVSPTFIRADRSVMADKIAHLQVSYTGSGSVGDNAEPGFFGKILGKIWPF